MRLKQRRRLSHRRNSKREGVKQTPSWRLVGRLCIKECPGVQYLWKEEKQDWSEGEVQWWYRLREIPQGSQKRRWPYGVVSCPLLGQTVHVFVVPHWSGDVSCLCEGVWPWASQLSATEAICQRAASWGLSTDRVPSSWGKKSFIEEGSGWCIIGDTEEWNCFSSLETSKYFFYYWDVKGGDVSLMAEDDAGDINKTQILVTSCTVWTSGEGQADVNSQNRNTFFSCVGERKEVYLGKRWHYNSGNGDEGEGMESRHHKWRAVKERVD